MPEAIEETTPLLDPKGQSKLRSILTLGGIGAVNLLANMAYSTLDPFFPQEAAKRKGAAADLEVGLIYGTFAAVIVVIAPLLGARVATIGPKFMLCAGVFLIGGSTFLFGFVAAIDSWTSFLVVCVLARAVQGCGTAAANTASWTIVATEFPDKMSTIFGVLETFTGLGFMIGPPLGGALYAARGFSLPFFVVGGNLLLCVAGLILTLPNTTRLTTRQQRRRRDDDNPTAWKLLKNIWMWMTLIALALAPGCLCMIEATLAAFLESAYQMKPATIGLLFLLCCAVYVISAPIVGRVADKWGSKRVIIAGLFTAALGDFLLAPSSLLSFLPEKQMWRLLLSSVIIAIGLAMTAVPTFSDMIQSTHRMGFEESIVLNGVVSGLWTSFYSIGEAVGPSIGGLITGKTDFRHSTTVFALTLAAHGCIYLILALCFRSRLK